MTDIQKTVLIIDDEKSIVRILSDTLQDNGIATLEAHDGVQGLETALKKHPDLVLLDVLMPKMDGITMLGKLREDEWGKDVPVLLLTNLSDFEKFSQAVESGVRDYMVKSDWQLEEIINKVKKKLEGK